MRFRNRAAAWWTQLKASRTRAGKTRITSWDKLKKHLRKTFLPFNYDHIMFQRLQNLRQGTRTVEEYSTEFFLLLTRIDIRDSEQQLVARFVGGLRQKIQHTLNLFHTLSVSEAHQQALTIEAQTKGNYAAWSSPRTSAST